MQYVATCPLNSQRLHQVCDSGVPQMQAAGLPLSTGLTIPVSLCPLPIYTILVTVELCKHLQIIG
jgi:hypothetical protein